MIFAAKSDVVVILDLIVNNCERFGANQAVFIYPASG